MKMKYWFTLAAALGFGLAAEPLFADDQPGAPAATNASTSPTTVPAPSGKKNKSGASKNASASKKAPATSEPMKAAPVAPGPAIVTQKNVNVRAQAAINSEVIARLKQGDHVNALEEVTLKKPKTDEPAKWAKVALPTNATTWATATFVNAADKTVVPKRLKVRSGPGENYSVLAIINKGTVLKEIESKGDWMKIEPPSEASGFIAAHLLAKKPATPATPPPVVPGVE